MGVPTNNPLVDNIQNSIQISPRSTNMEVVTNNPSVDNIGNIGLIPDKTSPLLSDSASDNVTRVTTDLANKKHHQTW